MLPDLSRVTSIIEEVAVEEALPRFRALSIDEMLQKTGGELVTAADLAVEKRLSPQLAGLWPGSLVVGEEAVEANPQLLRCFDQQAPVWTIDPIDGTANFARGSPVFAVMVGLTRGRELLGGWIHDPIGKRTAAAEAGGGAFLDDLRLEVASPAPVERMCGTLHAETYGLSEIRQQVGRRRHLLRTLKSLRCAGHEYLRLACGETHFAFFSRMNPWDHVPGVLIHRESGGADGLLDAKQYGPQDHGASGLLLAPDEVSWMALREFIFENGTGISHAKTQGPPRD